MYILPWVTLSQRKYPLHYITLHYITLHYITLHYITLHYITLHYITLHYITLHYITLHYITLHYITLHYITLHYITLHYITLHYITLHYITLHYITLHYITLHDGMGEAGLNSHVRLTLQKFTQINFFSECLNEIGDGELTTSSGSEFQMPTFAPTSKHVRQIVISDNGHNKFEMVPSGGVRVNRKFKKVITLNTDKSSNHFAIHQ